MIPRTVLVAACPFDGALSAQEVATAIGRGLSAGGWPADLCPLDADGRAGSEGIRELLDGLEFDARMRSARAVVLGEPRLHEDTLAGSVAFEIATRARQSGVPSYAVTAENALNRFDARILDLQAILQARGPRALQAAGKKLAAVI
jgi:glycerate kinase